MILRDYQLSCVESIEREFNDVRSTLAVMPTGTGKTPTALEVARRFTLRDERVLFLAHREELLTQARSMAERAFNLETDLELGQAYASEIFPTQLVLASVQTLISGRNGQRRMEKFSPYEFGLVIVDEMHHGTAASYRRVLDHFKQNPDLKILGVTATPERADEEALGQICDTVAFDYAIKQAIMDGWLVPVEQQLIDIQDLDFSHIRTTAGDLNASDLAAVMEAERNLYGICDATMKEIGQRRAIMFCVTVKQAELACGILNRYKTGIARWASGATPKEERRQIMKAFGDGQFQILVNCNLVSEGFDVPDAELLIQARPTKSKTLYTQQLGRIMRPLPGTVDGIDTPEQRKFSIADSRKPVATVMDFVGNAGRHKLVHAVDILGGKISDKIRELAEEIARKTGRPMDVDELVEEAERREDDIRRQAEAARKARLTARATYTMRTINPFDAFDIVAPPDRAWNTGKQLSEKQRLLLRKQSIDPDGLTYAEGKALINELFRRWEAGLCSLKQANLLKKYGYETHDMTRDQASALITAIRNNDWQRPQ